jgi:preprotein translocase SecE subunit
MAKEETKEIKKPSYFSEVRNETKKVIWPSFKNVMKYTLATLTLCIVFIIFFILINLLASFIKGMFI